MFPRRPLWKHMLLACLKHTAPVQISDMSALAQALGKIQETSTVLWKLNLSQRQTSYLIRKQEQRQAANQLYIHQRGKKMLKNPRRKLLLFSVLRRVFFLSTSILSAAHCPTHQMVPTLIKWWLSTSSIFLQFYNTQKLKKHLLPPEKGMAFQPTLLASWDYGPHWRWHAMK